MRSFQSVIGLFRKVCCSSSDLHISNVFLCTKCIQYQAHSFSLCCAKSSFRFCSNAPGEHTMHFDWMNAECPKFYTNAKNISVLTDPSKFYSTLKEMVENAHHRIIFSSLYLGTGPLEVSLVESLHTRLKHAEAVGSSLQVRMLFDCSRANRMTDTGSSVTLLLPLLGEFGSRMQLSLFHTPDLRGIRKHLLGAKYNEVIGVQHMKLYVVDDDLLISGANLSEDYFQNRQDRYMRLSNCAPLASFCSELVEAVRQCSLSVSPDGTQRMPADCRSHPYLDKNSFQYRNDLKRNMESVLQKYRDTTYPKPKDYNTTIYPLLECGPAGLAHDSILTPRLWRSLPGSWSVRLATGYFNLPPIYTHSLVHRSDAKFCILTAAPESNGFWKARGVMSGIPHAYTVLEQQLLRLIRFYGQQQRFSLREYNRKGWTYHAKGMWIYKQLFSECNAASADDSNASSKHSRKNLSQAKGRNLPFATVIGSSNFGYRSVYRDVEAQLLIETTCPQFQLSLHQEAELLYSRSFNVEEKTLNLGYRRVPLWVRAVTPFLRTFF